MIAGITHGVDGILLQGDQIRLVGVGQLHESGEGKLGQGDGAVSVAVLHGLGAFGAAQIQRLEVLKRHAHGGVQGLRNGQIAGTGAADNELLALEIGFRVDILRYKLLENGAVQRCNNHQVIVRTGFGK